MLKILLKFKKKNWLEKNAKYYVLFLFGYIYKKRS